MPDSTDTLAKPPVLRDWKDLPGPRGIPILGNSLQVKRGRIHLDFENWARIYGPMFRARFGKTPLLVITDHELIASVLRERPDAFKRPPRSKAVLREMGFQLGLFAAEGESWRNQRRMVMASVSPTNVRAYFPSLVKVVTRLEGRWMRACAAHLDIDLQSDLMRYTVDAIAGLAFGSNVNTLESDDDVIQKHLDKIFPALFSRTLSIIPYWRHFRLPKDRALERSVLHINLAIEKFIAQARSHLEADPLRRAAPQNLLEAMIVAADAPDSGLNDRDVAGNVLTMLLAGEDTTANTLAWMIHLLWSNPEALARARAEVRGILGRPEDFTREALAQLEYVDACAQETMRLKPVAPMIPLEANSDMTVGDVRISAGTLVWSIFRQDAVRGTALPRAGVFLPERWLENAPTDMGGAMARRVSMPFGGGPRVCPGRYLALLEIKMAIAMLLTSFDIESVGTPEGTEPEELMSFTMSPVGLRLRLRPRA